VFNELGEVVGIAFQSYAGSDAENIGCAAAAVAAAVLLLPASCAHLGPGLPLSGDRQP